MDIIGIGDSGMDVTLEIDSLPKRGNKCRAKELSKNPGGIIGNFCSAAARLGMKCGIVSAVGNDEYGEAIAKDYRKNGIDTTHLFVADDAPTFYAIVFLDGQGEKYLFTVDSPLLSPSPEKIDFSYLATAKYVHMNSMDHRLAEYVTRNMSGGEARMTLDYEIHASNPGLENWLEVFKRIAVLFINQAGLESLFDADIEEAAQVLLSYGAETVVVTCAEKGGYACSRRETVRYEAFAVDKVADTTGAGDCFNAAFLSARIMGKDLRDSVRAAAAAAALSIQKVGARTGHPSMAELERFIANSESQGMATGMERNRRGAEYRGPH